MRVVHIATQHFPLDVRIFLKECRTLAAAGIETHMLVPDPPVTEKDGVHIHAVDRCTTLPPIYRIWKRLSTVAKQALAYDADIYHFHDAELMFVGLWLRHKGRRVVYDVHEDSPREAISLYKDRPFYGRVRGTVFGIMEHFTKSRMSAYVCVTPQIAAKFPPQQTILVQNFAMLDEFPSFEQNGRYKDRPPNIAYFGVLTDIRGMREMITAMGELPPGVDAKLQLAGNFASPELQAEMTAKPGWGRVEFLGWQERAAILRLLSNARIGLVIHHPEPIFMDGLPIKLFEYMAAGIPVIVSDFPVLRELVGKANCGLLIDPFDTKALAAGIEYLLTHPDEAAEMGRRGREAILSTYNWEAEGKKLVALYHELMKTP